MARGDRQAFGDQPSGLRCPHKTPSKVTWGVVVSQARRRIPLFLHSPPALVGESPIPVWGFLVGSVAPSLCIPISLPVVLGPSRTGSSFEVGPKLSPMGRGGAEPHSLPFSGSLGGKCFQLKFQNGSSALSGSARGRRRTRTSLFHEWMWQELSVLLSDPATTAEPTNKVSRRPF